MRDKLGHFEVILGSMEKIQKELDDLKGWINLQIFETTRFDIKESAGYGGAEAEGDETHPGGPETARFNMKDPCYGEADAETDPGLGEFITSESEQRSPPSVSDPFPSKLVQPHIVKIKDEIIDEDSYLPDETSAEPEDEGQFASFDEMCDYVAKNSDFDDSSAVGSSRTPAKRICLNLEEKVEIIQAIELNGGKINTVCLQMNKPKSTLHSIWRNKDKILSSFAKSNTKCKRMRRCEFPEVDQTLYNWLDHQKRINPQAHIDATKLLTKAVEFAKSFQCDQKFKASRGWLDRWKLRHNVSLPKVGKKDSTSEIYQPHDKIS